MYTEHKYLDVYHGHIHVEYHHGPFHVTFPANQTSVSFDISLIDDNEVGEDEKFSLDILDPSLPEDVKLLNPSCEVTIVDTTSKSVVIIGTLCMYMCYIHAYTYILDGERFAGLTFAVSVPSKFSRKYFHVALAISSAEVLII